MKRRRLKYKNILLLSLIVIIIFVIIVKPKNYTKNYQVDNYSIQEQYNKQKKEYYFNINNDKLHFEYYIESNYHIARKLIKSIKEYTDNKYVCITLSINNISTIHLCNNGITNIDYHLVDDEMLNNLSIKANDSVTPTSNDNINIFNLVNKKYLIWNYHNFKYISSTESKDINIFNTDYYNISLAKVIGDYLIILNYDQVYEFNEFILINLKNLKTKTWKIKYDISLDSYVLGIHDKSLFLVDKNSKIEYELVPSY